jgi:hypothetical protein
MGRGKDFGLTMSATMINRADGVDHVSRLQPKSGRDPRLARRAATNLTTGAQQFRTCRLVDRAVNASAAQQ